MNHTEYQQLISQFIDRELRSDEEQELFTHLGLCEECRGFLKASLTLQGDISATKGKMASPSSKMQHEYAADRGPMRQAARQARGRSPLSTFILLALVTLIIGLLFSANIRVQRPHETIQQESIQLQ